MTGSETEKSKIQNEPKHHVDLKVRKCSTNDQGILKGHRNNLKELSVAKAGII